MGRTAHLAWLVAALGCVAFFGCDEAEKKPLRDVPEPDATAESCEPCRGEGALDDAGAPSEACVLYHRLCNSPSVTVEVERRGGKVTLEYTFK